MKAIKIRKATMNDFDELLKLKLESKKEERKENRNLRPVNKVKSHYAEYLKRDLKSEYRVILIAVLDNEIIGMVIGRIYRSLKIDGYERRVSMGNLFVKKKYRGKSIATKLIRAFTAWAKSRKAKRLTLNIYPKNKIVKEMYSKIGFKEFCITMHKKC